MTVSTFSGDNPLDKTDVQELIGKHVAERMGDGFDKGKIAKCAAQTHEGCMQAPVKQL